MSTSNLGFSSSTLRTTALPILSASLYTLGLLGGLYNFSDPVGGAKAFGITIPASSSSKGTTSTSTPTAVEKAYIRIHGIRNFGTGIGGLATLAFLQFSQTCKASPVAADAVRKVIGLGLMLGCIVGFGDGWILRQFVKDGQGEVSAETEELARKQAQGHTLMAVPILGLGVAWWFA